MYSKARPKKKIAQAIDSNQIINLEDWSITFNEFQPDGNKQLKKHASEESQDKGMRDCVSNVVKKATMLIIVQQSVKRILPKSRGIILLQVWRK
jgi:hypothetical protein